MTRRILALGLATCLAAPVLAQTKVPDTTSISLAPIETSAPRVWAMGEIRISGVPLEGANPFDPDVIAVDVSFTSPSKQVKVVPAFWYRPFSRELKKGADGSESESMTARGEGEWRVRWTPLESGRHQARVTVRRAGRVQMGAASTWSVLGRDKADATSRGFAQLNPSSHRYFQTSDGRPLPLLGENLCWPGARGTYDYDDWLPKMRAARMNYARLWMHNAAFSAEFFPGERQNYNQERLWKLDYVLDEARRNGVYTMLCLDYHGVFQTQPDMWGGNDWWFKHAYSTATGGPAEKPNDFFTNDAAQALYRKRLRYLVARYGAFPNLLSWQFFNEINNVYGDASKTRQENRDALKLNPPDVVDWHARQSKYLRALDPYHHLITTSFGSAGEQPAMWQLSDLDYANWHWYGNWAGRGGAMLDMERGIGERFPSTYAKPVTISEFGTDGRTSSAESDPLRRGLHQAIWAGIFSGTAGSSMPWWWEQIDKENLYSQWANLRAFLPEDFGSAKWAPQAVSAPKFTVALGAPVAGGAAFNEPISLLDSWGAKPDGPAIINRAGDGAGSSLNGYIHGSSKSQERAPWLIQANLGDNARLILHLNSVSNEAILVVKQDGRELLRRELPNKDGGFERNHEYDEDIAIPLRAGRSEIAVENPGGDWIYLDSARLEGVLPAATSAGPLPLEAFALGDGSSTLLWAVDANYSWPRGRAEVAKTARGGTATLPALKAGNYRVQWWSPSTAQVLGTQNVRAGVGGLKLALPDFEADIAARVTLAR